MIISMLSNKLFLYIIVRALLVLLLMTLSLYQRKLSKVRYFFLIEQNKSFECGFDQFDKKYLGFCVQYIKTAFLFLKSIVRQFSLLFYNKNNLFWLGRNIKSEYFLIMFNHPRCKFPNNLMVS